MPVHGIDALPPLGSVAPPALIPLELMSWLPTWITPVWVIAIGLVAGLLVTLASYAVLVALSFIPPLGHLADKRPVATGVAARSEEHTSELQSLRRISYAVFCLKKKK